MANLLDSLHSAGGALGVYQRALEVIQNNVSNASTPGYVKQSLQLEALPFDVAGGLAGGVSSRGLDSARNEYAEDEVRRQLQSLGFYDGQAQAATALDSLFDVSGTSGLPAALTGLFQSLSAWSVSPTSTDARQNVLAAAGTLATSVQTLASNLTRVSEAVQDQIGSTVDQINQLIARIQQYNVARGQKATADPGTDANAHAALEQLANLINTTTLVQPDGTITVLLNGGAPLVLGNSQYPISASRDGAGVTAILDWQGNDVTSQIAGGNLGGLLDAAGRIVPNAQAAINQFAESFATTVNGVLTSGTVGPDDPAGGEPLFTYDSAKGASSLTLSSTITAGNLAAVDASGNANGNALQLASLANSTAAGGIAGATFGDFLSGIAAAAGRESAAAQQNATTQQQVVAQTKVLRDQSSSVSLDDQAVLLMQFQRSYQAVAKLITTLNDMAGDVIDTIR